MANDSDYALPLSDSHDDTTSSDEVVEVIPESPVVKRGRPAKAKSTNTSNEMENQTSLMTKPQTKTSWVWDYFIKKHSSETGEMRAYCKFETNNEKCTKNYKYDGSTGNLSSHLIKHGIIPPAENIVESISQLTIQQTSTKKYGQKEKEESTLRWILSTTQPLSTVTHKAYIEHMHNIDPEFVVPGEKR